MELKEFEGLLSDLESHRVERKSSASDMEKIQQASIATARQQLRKNVNPELEFDVTESFVGATIRRAM